MSFGENLQTLRKELNLSQEQLAKDLFVSRQAVSKWESGTAYPDIEKIIAISEYFQCPIDNLLKGNVISKGNDKQTDDKCIYEAFSKEKRKCVLSGMTLMEVAFLMLFIFPSNYANIKMFNTPITVLDIQIILFSLLIAISIYIFVYGKTREKNFRKKHRELSVSYSTKEIDSLDSGFEKNIALSIFLFVISFVLLIFLVTICSPQSMIPLLVFIVCISLSINLFCYTIMRKNRCNIEKYNAKIRKKDNKKMKDE